MRHEERKRLSMVWLKPLVVVLYWSLLSSIGLFIAGLLYQLQLLSTSFDERARVLETTWALGLIFAAGIIAIIAATTIHAIRFDCSPFEGSLSRVTLRLLQLMTARWNWRIRIQLDWKFNGSALVTTYMRLVTEASDPRLLDRAVPSFSYQWLSGGMEHMELLEQAYERLLASDASTRVRETVHAECLRFSAFCREHMEWTHTTLKRNMIDFLVERCASLAQYPAGVFFTSFDTDNADLLTVSSLPAEECIARVLCTYDQDKQLGCRVWIFRHALKYCHTLLDNQKLEDLNRILSHVDYPSVLRSLFRAPFSFQPAQLLRYLIQGREIEALRILIPLLTSSEIPQRSDFHIAVNLGDMMQNIDTEIEIPSDIDLSPYIALIVRERVSHVSNTGDMPVMPPWPISSALNRPLG